MKTKIVIIGLFACIWIKLGANTLHFKTYDIEDGLCNNYISCCAQDAYGFMWFGTRTGLNRFNSKTFYMFPEASLLVSNNIYDIEKSPTGEMWVSTEKGLQKYDYQTNTFNLIDFTEGISCYSLQFDQKGNLWMLQYGRSLVKYDKESNTHTNYMYKDGKPIVAFTITPQDDIWAATANGDIVFMDKNHKELVSMGITPIKDISTIWASPQDNLLLIGTIDNGIKRIDLQNKTCKDILPWQKESPLYTRKMTRINDNQIWIGTFNGIYIYNIHLDTITSIQQDQSNPYSLSSNAIQDICTDNTGGIWICTDNGGINYVPPYSEFRWYYEIVGKNSIKGNVIHDICIDHNNNIWIGTEDAGINKYDVKKQSFKNFNHKNNLSQDCIHGLIAIDNLLYIGTHANGIDVMDLNTERIIKHYNLPTNGLTTTYNLIVYLYKTRDKQLYVATNQGVYRFNVIQDRFDIVNQFPNNCRIQTLFEDHEGVIWAGTSTKGLYYYNPANGQHGEFKLNSTNRNRNSTINHIYEDKQHNLWFATEEGIKKYDRNTNQTSHYDMDNGMPSAVTFRIEEDNKGYLWISTANGLACLDPIHNTIKVFEKGHGLISNQFNYNSSLQTPDGTLFFGSLKGMISFRPDDIQDFPTQPKTYISQISYNDPTQNTLKQEDIRLKDKIKLAYNQSTFHIDYISLNYQAPNLTRYAYRMEGLSKEWNQITGENRIYFTKLPPGTYTFMVKSANVSGIWGDPATLQITILPPWWLSTWAKILYVLLFCGGIILLFMFVFQRNKAKMLQTMKEFENAKEKELYRAKIDFFINIAHEIRTPLTLIKTPLEQLEKDTELSISAKKYTAIINKNTNRLLNLVNQLLDFRKTEIEGYKLNFVQVDILALIHEIYDYFHETAERNSLRLSIECNEDTFYAYIDKEACTKILSNLLSNAIKYARSLIIIRLKVQNTEQFTIEVINDGEKIPEGNKEKIFEPFFRNDSEAHIGTGLGLPLARSLAEMHDGTLELSESMPGFNTFSINLPINHPHSLHLQEEKDEHPIIEIETDVQSYITHKSMPTILIVEDNKEMLHFIAREINVHYNIATSSNGKEAMACLKEYSIQLIISDIVMPVMDGLSLLKAVKNNLEFSHIPVILLTSKNALRSHIEGLEQGADAYIDKPFSMELLLTQVTNLLNNRDNMRTYYFNSPITNIKSIAYTKTDEKFLKKLNEIINSHIDDVNLDVDMIADLMNLSRPTLYRKISAISNLTPNELIKITRLKKAAELIAQGEMKIYEIAEAVGFKSQPYFSQSFSKQFNMSPSQYAKKNGQGEKLSEK